MKHLPKLQKILAAIGFAALVATVLAVPIQVSAQSVDSSSDRKIKQKVAPAYPELAKHANITGTVKLEATILPNGSVKSVKLIGGHPLLAGAAEDALRKWRYEPATSETTTLVEFHFNPGM